jgi:sulfate permease, SulP family
MIGSSETQSVPVSKGARRPLTAQQVAVELSAGLLGSLLSLSVSLSLAALIFSGPLAGFTASGVGVTLVSVAVMNLVVALVSPRPPMIVLTQDAPGVIVAVMTAQLAAALAGSPPATLYATVVAAIALTTTISGAVFLLLGRFRLGSLVRYLPYPVVGGFLAGTGWLLVLGGLSIMTGGSTELAALPGLFTASAALLWLPGFLFGCLLVALLRRAPHPLITPALLCAATLLFYLWLFVSGTPLAEAQARGLLLGPFPSGPAWQPLTPAMLAEVQWGTIGGQLGAIGAAVTIGVIGLLLNVSGLQLARREAIDLNRELGANGLGQLLAGMLGGPPGFTALGISTFGHRMGARTMLAGLAASLVLGLVFLFGVELLGLVPRLVLGGVVCYLGLAFLVEWLYDAWFRLTRLDYALVLAILALVIVFGMLTGVVAGLAIAVALFVIAYSRVSVVKHTLSGATLKSRMTRGHAAQQQLREQGEQIAIFQLQGFLFFGTASELQERVSRRLLLTGIPPLRFVLLDFRLVPRIDATAVLSFARLLQLAEERDITLVFTQLAPPIEEQLARGLLGGGQGERVRIFPSLDHGLEWCENALLAELPALEARAPWVLDPQMMVVLADFEQQRFAPGDYLIRQGDEPSDLFLIEEGQVTAQIEAPGEPPARLESMRGGRVVGELGFLLGTRRTAAVVADEPTVARRVTRAALERLEAERPEAAAALNELLARLLSERVVHLIGTVEALQR